MSKVRVCFLGTPDFAVTSLKRLLDDEHFDVVGVVTQPDRPSGRKMMLTPTPVKSLATARGVRVMSPESVNRDLILAEIQKWGAEVAVVVAFGQILSQRFLDSFPFGAVNVHGSILPRWRGAAPIQRAIQHGDTETGVALQKVVKELDAGDLLGVRKVQIGPNMDAKELHDELAPLGADLLHVELMDYVRGNLAPTPQSQAGITYAKKIDKAESEIKWNSTAQEIHNRVRAFVMGPGTWVSFAGKKLKVHKTKIIKELTGEPGKVLKITQNQIVIATSQGAIDLLEVQPESRNKMPIVDFIKSVSLKEGDLFV